MMLLDKSCVSPKSTISEPNLLHSRSKAFKKKLDFCVVSFLLVSFLLVSFLIPVHTKRTHCLYPNAQRGLLFSSTYLGLILFTFSCQLDQR